MAFFIIKTFCLLCWNCFFYKVLFPWKEISWLQEKMKKHGGLLRSGTAFAPIQLESPAGDLLAMLRPAEARTTGFALVLMNMFWPMEFREGLARLDGNSVTGVWETVLALWPGLTCCSQPCLPACPLGAVGRSPAQCVVHSVLLVV